MDDIESVSSSSTPQKRSAPGDEPEHQRLLNLKGTQFVFPTPPDTEESSNASSGDGLSRHETARASSPAPSSPALSSIIDLTGSVAARSTNQTLAVPPTQSAQPPAKRRKLTPTEQLEKQRAKEAKEAQKQEDKIRKEEERRVKDEEKRVKDEEKRKKAEDREAKKREKDLEEERKTQEQLKKQRQQMRLGAFFQQKSTTPSKNGEDALSEFQTGITARRRSLSFEAFDNAVDQIRGSASPSKAAASPRICANLEGMGATTKKPDQSDYCKTFLPFQLPSHSTLAPTPFAKTAEELDAAQADFDRDLSEPSIEAQPLSLLSYFPDNSLIPRGTPIPPMKNLVAQIQGAPSQPIDLTDGGNTSTVTSMDQLRSATVKYLHFHEDVRPAYCGTYTKIQSPRKRARLQKNPFSRIRRDTDYDYDSEAEWEEPEEGEDLVSDDEDEVDEGDATDDIAAFLDDAEDAGRGRAKVLTSDLVPASTGLCWENPAQHVHPISNTDGDAADLRSMGLGFLVPGCGRGRPIDPFSTEYWHVDSPEKPKHATAAEGEPPMRNSPIGGAMAPPPRQPLLPRPNCTLNADLGLVVGGAKGEKGPITSVAAPSTTTTAEGGGGAKRGPKPAPKVLNKEDLDDFKTAVIGSPLGKLELQKGLKSRFPKITIETIKETLGSHFAQVGTTKAAKKWVFVGDQL